MENTQEEQNSLEKLKVSFSFFKFSSLGIFFFIDFCYNRVQIGRLTIMEKLSRVKKYEALRKSIEMDNAIDASSHMKEPQTKEVLKTFDTSVFKKVDIVDEDKKAKRAKDEELKKEEVKDTFTNEYLDDFIKEVREYNIRKGNRESENTEVDILYQLNAANRAKRTHYIQEIADDRKVEDLQPVLSKEEITQQVQKMLLEEPLHEHEALIENDRQEVIDEATHQTNIDLKQAVELVGIHDDQVEIEKEETDNKSVDLYDDLFVNNHTKEVEMQLIDTEEINVVEDEEIINEQTSQDVLKKKLLAETQQLRVQLDEYEDELTGLSDDLEKNNKLLNFVLCFLIVVLLIIIGFIAYSIWRAGGI